MPWALSPGALPSTNRGREELAARAARDAIRFLIARRTADGLWTDFDTLAGPSIDWVSAFVAVALVRSGEADGVAAALETWKRLRRRRRWSAGWGFNDRVPSDADTTTWVLHLGAALGAGRNRRALHFVSRHITGAGGVRTFANGWAIGAYTRLLGRSFAGWCGEHACVSAAAATLPDLPQGPRVLAWLREAQRGRGLGIVLVGVASLRQCHGGRGAGCDVARGRR